MGWTRRELLLGATAIGAAAVTAGCTSRIGGDPRANAEAERSASSEPSASVPPELEQVTIGIVAYEPYTVTDGELKGPVPDVARAVLEKLGVSDVKFEQVHQEEQLLLGLRMERFDLVAGLFVRSDLCSDIAFSIPDHVALTAFAVKAGNPKGLKTYADIVAKKATVAVMANLPDMRDATAAGVPSSRIKQFPDPNTLLEAVRRGAADCGAYDDIALRDLMKTKGEGLEVTDPFRLEDRLPYVGAYGFPMDTTELLEPFNEQLRELHDSGEWLEMVEPFGFTEDNDPPSDVTTEQACSA